MGSADAESNPEPGAPVARVALGNLIRGARKTGLRLRPIMMTMFVATLGLLPAALSHVIGSDFQRPFAIVIVGGLLANLVIGIFLLPTLYVWVARDNDILPEVEDGEKF
jgi:cobalt-zinc-cadmium resistance protein CzcA